MNDKPLPVHDKERSSLWDQPVRRRAVPGKLHTGLIRALKILLPVVALSVVLLVLAWPRIEDAMAPAQRQLVQSKQNNGRNELMNPVFNSVDNHDEPYQVTATRAVQSINNTDVILLDKPTANIILNSGHVIDGNAVHGTYTQSEGKLLLEGDVTLHEEEGYVAKTSKAVVNAKTHQSSSDQPVRVTGPSGTIDATGMQVNSDSQVLIFTGPAKMMLNQDGGKL